MLFTKKLLSFNILNILLEVFQKISKPRKKQLLFLMVFILFNGFAELLPLASIVPFLTVITNPELLLKYPLFTSLIDILQINNNTQFVLCIVFIFASTVIFAASIRLINLWASAKLSAAIGSDISVELYKRNLYKTYESHLNVNSSEVINAALIHVDKTVELINATLQFLSFLVIAISLLIGLFIFNFKITLTLVLTFFIVYLFIGLKFRKRLIRNSEFSVRATNLQIKILQESLGSIKDTIINGSQSDYLKIFRNLDVPIKKTYSENYFLSTSPRFALEALGLIMISIIAFFITLNDASKTDTVIPILGTLGLGAQRLLPAMQGVYLSWSQINYLSSSAKKTIDFLNIPISKPNLLKSKSQIKFESKIEIKNLTYVYPKSNKKVLDGVNLQIFKGEKIGIIGETGCGKSTLFDVLMGLLPATTGKFYVDNKEINFDLYPKTLAKWKASICHVPQRIYLTDNSFAENIAFSVPKSEINLKRVINAAKKAQISNYIESTEEKYNTVVGEMGIRISGGQRQRIALARAFYNKKNILFLDEATSALDGLTEKLVMEAIRKLGTKVTVIIIAHRQNTLSFCDRVITLKKGKVFKIT